MTGHWLVFFSMQAPILVMEAFLKKYAKKKGVSIPTWLSVCLCLSGMLGVADLFFYPPIYRTDLDLRVVNAIRDNCLRLLHLLRIL